jgi:hypothetical protein
MMQLTTSAVTVTAAVLYFTSRTAAEGQCGKLLCIPGIDAMGIGFDSIKGSSTGLLPVVQFSYDPAHAKQYVNPFNSSLKYAVPGKANVQDNTAGESDVHTTSYSSSQDYAKDLAKSASVGIEGAFSADARVQSAQSFLEHRNTFGSLTVSTVTVSLYDIALDPIDQLSPTSSFKTAVLALPAVYNSTTTAQYAHLISYYGTDIITAATFGGKGEMTIAVNTAFSSTHTSTDVKKQAGLHFHWVKAGASSSSNHTDANSSFVENSIIQTKLSGGDPTDMSDWAAWENTFYNAPAQIEYTVRPLSDLVRTFTDTSLADNIDLAVADLANQAETACSNETAEIASLTEQIECTLNATFCYLQTVNNLGLYAFQIGEGDALGGGSAVCDPTTPTPNCYPMSGDNMNCLVIGRDGIKERYPIYGMAQSTADRCLVSHQPLKAIETERPVTMSTAPVSGDTCGGMLCIPGIDKMGAGFNIITGSTDRLLPVVQFSYGLSPPPPPPPSPSPPSLSPPPSPSPPSSNNCADPGKTPTCNTCAACCHTYIPNGAQCDACVSQNCKAPNVCADPGKTPACNTCSECCHSYIPSGAQCNACVAQNCPKAAKKSSVYVNPFNSALRYAVPREASVVDNTGGDSSVSSRTYFSSDEFAHDLTKSASAKVTFGAFSGSAQVSTAKSYLRQTSSYGSYTVSSIKDSLYDVAINPTAELNVTNNFLTYARTQLPQNYENHGLPDPAYAEFISYYGTHVVTAATFGGVGEVTIAVNSNYSASHNSADIAAQASIHLGWIKAGAGASGNTSDSRGSFLNNSAISTSLTGGDPMDLTDWETWEKTFYNAPAMIAYTLRPISEIVRVFVNSTIASNVDKAVAQLTGALLPPCSTDAAEVAHLTHQIECADKNVLYCYNVCLKTDGSQCDPESDPYLFLKVRQGDGIIQGQKSNVCIPSIAIGQDTNCYPLSKDKTQCLVPSGGSYPIYGVAISTLQSCLGSSDPPTPQPSRCVKDGECGARSRCCSHHGRATLNCMYGWRC